MFHNKPARRGPPFPNRSLHLVLLFTLAYPSPSYASPSSSFEEQRIWGFGKGLNPLNLTTLIIDLVLGLIFLLQAYKQLKLLISKLATPAGRLLLPSIVIFLLSAVSIVAHFGIHAAWVAIARTDFIGSGIPVLTAGFITWLNHTMYVGDVLIVAGFLYLCLYRAAVIHGADQAQSFAMSDVASESQVHLQAPGLTRNTSTTSQDLQQAAAPTPSTIHPRVTVPILVKGVMDAALVLGSIVPLAFMARAISILSDPAVADLPPSSSGVVILPPRLKAAGTMFINSSRAYIGMFAALSIYLFVSSLLAKNSSDKRGLSDNTTRTLANVVSPLLVIWATIVVVFHVLLHEIAQKDLITGDRATLFTTIRTGVFHFPFYVLFHRLVMMDRAPEPTLTSTGEKRVLGYEGMRERAFNS